MSTYNNNDDATSIAPCSEELNSQLYFLWRISATFGVALLIFVAGKLWSKVSKLEAKIKNQASSSSASRTKVIEEQQKEATGIFDSNNKKLLSPIEEEAPVFTKLFLADLNEKKPLESLKNTSFCENCQNQINLPSFYGNGSVINSETEGLRKRKRDNNPSSDQHHRVEGSFHGSSDKYQPVFMNSKNTQRQSATGPDDFVSSPSRIISSSSNQQMVGRPPRIESSQLILNNNDGQVTEIELGDWSMYDEQDGSGRGQRQRIKIVTTLDIEIKPNNAENRRYAGGRPIRINIHSFALKEGDEDQDQNGIDQTDLVEEKVEQEKVEEEPEHIVPSLLEVMNVHTVEEVVQKVETLESVGDIIRDAGLESSNLIFGIDYTASNKFQGKKSFGGKSLHAIEPGLLNPYQQVISVLGKTLASFATSGFIAGYGFGDAKTEDKGVFPLCTESGFCTSFSEVLDVYNKVTPHVVLSGPTNFAPLIYEAINICKQVKTYHILVIVADGQVTNELQTKEAIVEACKYPLSIIVVGVGDGPWGMMKEFDVSLPKRTWDNFHFVSFHKITSTALNPDLAFSVQALVEIPDQFKKIKALGLLKQ